MQAENQNYTLNKTEAEFLNKLGESARIYFSDFVIYINRVIKDYKINQYSSPENVNYVYNSIKSSLDIATFLSTFKVFEKIKEGDVLNSEWSQNGLETYGKELTYTNDDLTLKNCSLTTIQEYLKKYEGYFSNCMPDFYQLLSDEQFADIVQNINQQTYQKYIQLCKTTDGISKQF